MNKKQKKKRMVIMSAGLIVKPTVRYYSVLGGGQECYKYASFVFPGVIY